MKSTCDSYKKCLDCSHVYEPDPNAGRGGNRCVPEHGLGWGECCNCEEIGHLTTYQCHIQHLLEDVDDPKLKRVTSNEVGACPFIEPDPGDADTQVLWRESLINCTATTKPPLMPRETRHPFMSVPRLT